MRSRQWAKYWPLNTRSASSNVPRLGASLAYYTLFAIAPILLVATAIAGGVLVAIGLVALTDWELLDPLIALAVGGESPYGGVRRKRHIARRRRPGREWPRCPSDPAQWH